MDSSLKQRLVGAIVLIALAVIFLPMLVKGPAPDSGVSDVSLAIPAEPKPTGDATTRDFSLTEPGATPQGGAVGMPATTPEPTTAEPAQDSPFPTVAAGDYAVSFGSYANTADADKVIAALRAAELPGYRETVQLNGRDAQRVRIGPFADRAVAEAARLRAAQVNAGVGAKVVTLDANTTTAAPAPTSTAVAAASPESVKAEPLPPAPKPVAIAPVPKPATPASKPAVEPKPAAPAPAKPVATTPPAPKPETVSQPKPADTSKTGFVVQVGAFADANAATALRDKLRGAGFNAFTDAVNTDAGKRTRVRVGPAMNRAEADALKAQVKSKLGIDGIVRPHP